MAVCLILLGTMYWLSVRVVDVVRCAGAVQNELQTRNADYTFTLGRLGFVAFLSIAALWNKRT